MKHKYVIGIILPAVGAALLLVGLDASWLTADQQSEVKSTPTTARITPSEGQFTPTTARITPSEGRFTPTTARITPSEGRLTPPAARSTPSPAAQPPSTTPAG